MRDRLKLGQECSSVRMVVESQAISHSSRNITDGISWKVNDSVWDNVSFESPVLEHIQSHITNSVLTSGLRKLLHND